MILNLNPKRVLVAMSGGVDSSVCASLLRDQGYDVIGVTIKTWAKTECGDERSKSCCSLRDIDDARAVAGKLGIPYYVMDLSVDFKSKVIDYFSSEYLSGRTPNPCIECNNHIKFGILKNKADELEAGFIATGHYAQIGYEARENRYFIREGADAAKDQSYVLFGLQQEQLSRMLLPVGAMEKKKVRAVAEKLGLRIHDKPDSQEICFVPGNYASFLEKNARHPLPGSGLIKNEAGEVLGHHEGSHRYTIGQRKGILVPHSKPLFVTSINAEKNEITVGDEADLYSSEMRVRKVNWQLGPRTGPVQVKIRYKNKKTSAHIVETSPTGYVRVRFDHPIKAVTPGQAAVFYDGDRVLGGGWIESASRCQVFGGVAQTG